jgi:hypothetical protein
MWQLIVVVAVIAVALVYVIRSLARSARGEDCRCGTGTCSLKDQRSQTSLPCQNASPAIPAESLEESARNLSRKTGSASPQ